MEYHYHLAPYKGTASRLVCPSCGRKGSFVPYVDADGNILSETCGRCNHESSCGYHLTPAQYFQDHPEARPLREDWRYCHPERREGSIHRQFQPKREPPQHICELPKDIVEKTLRLQPESNFLHFLGTLFDPLIVEGLADQYHLGVTQDRSTIFYQIDGRGRYRGGKIVQYDPLSGHRVKDNVDIPVNWVHTAMKRKGLLPEGWTMTQCLFGEHLLSKYPDRLPILVEAEKTAVICSGLLPEFVWLATGGKTQLGDKLDILGKRRFLVIPDADAFDTWTEAFDKRPYLNYTFSRIIEDNASDEDREAKIDIADWLIRLAREKNLVPTVPPVPSQNGTEHPQGYTFRNPLLADIAHYFSPEYLPEIDALMTDLDLVPVSIEPINPNPNAQ